MKRGVTEMHVSTTLWAGHAIMGISLNKDSRMHRASNLLCIGTYRALHESALGTNLTRMKTAASRKLQLLAISMCIVRRRVTMMATD